MARSALLGFFERVSRVYFRETEIVGNVPSADTRGRVFAANHVNGLVDPLLVMTTAPCAIAPIGKSTLWKIPVLKWILDAVGAVPVVRRKDDPSKPSGSNDEVFVKVAEHLGRGGNVLIFPEGTSHNEPRLGSIKTGGARMLARAKAEGAAGLTFQAVGLEFDARENFRSRVLVIYGPVREVDAISGVASMSQDDLVQRITEQLKDDLSELIVEGTTWDDRLLIARVAELFANDSGDGSLAAWNEIGRRVEAARKAIAPERDAVREDVARAVGRYHDALTQAELTDADVAIGAKPHPWRRRTLLALTLPLAIPGALLYYLPYQVPRMVAARVAGKSADEISTYKLATGLVLFPLWTGALVSASLAMLPPPASLLAAGVAMASPFAALHWVDYLDQRARSRGRGRVGTAHLSEMRCAVMELLETARAEFDRAPVPA